LNTVLRFDSNRLRSELEALPPGLRAAFAALCARRLARAFAGPTSEAQAFAELHARLWHAVALPETNAVAAADAAERALALLPPDDGADPLADDAAAALTYALRAVASGDPNDAAWAAECVYNALHAFLQDQGFDPAAPGGEEALVSHPLVQAELRRQADDLRALRNLGAAGLSPRPLDVLRDRADDTARRIFG
jgi:hypothetical protein